MDSTVEERKDLLSRFICMKDEDDKPYSDQYLRDIIINALLAGRDTTSQLLLWGLYLLSQNPDKEAKLLEEIQNTLENEPPNYENTKNMKYLKAVLDETLRQFPPVPIDRKTAQSDDVLPNGMFVPKGTIVFWSLFVMGRMHNYYENPLAFVPERWLTEDQPKHKAFMPFLFGPRICLGQTMAYTQAKVVMCLLLPLFQFHVVPDQIIHYDAIFLTLRAKYGIKMKVTKRQ